MGARVDAHNKRLAALDSATEGGADGDGDGLGERERDRGERQRDVSGFSLEREREREGERDRESERLREKRGLREESEDRHMEREALAILEAEIERAATTVADLTTKHVFFFQVSFASSRPFLLPHCPLLAVLG